MFTLGVPWTFFTGEFQIDPGSDGSPSVGELMPPGSPRGSGVTSDGERVISADASNIFSCVRVAAGAAEAEAGAW